MIWLVIFLMICSFGLGVSWNVVWTNMKALDEMIKRHKREQQEFENKFKQSTEQIVNEVKQTSTNDLKAQVTKKKH
jgi:cytochrome c biogenesis protein ResB